MRTTPKRRVRFDILRPRSIVIFVGLAALWAIVALAPAWQAVPLKLVARLAGYGGFAAMLVPYLHIVRRCFRYRQGAPMTRWLRWHIGSAYLAFFMVLVHCQGRAEEPLTRALLWLTWTVMVSGVVGYYGQKLLYYLLPRVVAREFGLERLEPQRGLVLATATGLLEKKEIKQSAEVIRKFCETAVEQCFAPSFALWRGWGRKQEETLSENWYHRTRTFADPQQAEILQTLWELIQMRRSMDLEYRLHQIGRLWLLVHGPAAWALLILMIEHAALSMWYGGF